MNYRFAYRIGVHPCADAGTDPAFVEKISELFTTLLLAALALTMESAHVLELP